MGGLIPLTSNSVQEGANAAPAVPLPRLLLIALPIQLAAGVLAIGGVAGGAPVLTITAIVAGSMLAIGGSLLTMCMIRRMGLVEERRKHVRFQRELKASINGHPARVTDLSLGGASLIAEMPAPPSIGSEVELTMELATGATKLRATVRRAPERGYFARMGIEFAEGQRNEIVKLALALLHSDITASETTDVSEAAPVGARRAA